MGDVEVPAEALWRAQTQRAVDNFPISGQPLPPSLIHALARIKAAAARANADLGVVTADAARRDRGRGRGDHVEASTTTSSRSTCSRPGRAPAPT